MAPGPRRLTRIDLSTDETFAWVCGSFGVLLILLLSSALTLRTFVARDKYVLVAALMGVAPIFAATPPRRFSWMKQGNTSKVFLFINLLFILCGSLWLGAAAVRPYVPRFNPRALSLAYVVSAAVILVCARRAMVKGSEHRWLDAVNAVLLFVTPLALVSATILPSEWYLTHPFHTAAARWGAALASVMLIVWRSKTLNAFTCRGKALGLIAGTIGFVAPFALMDAQLTYDALHYTAYLAPATAVLAGRVPLIDVFCQYGQSYLLYDVAFLFLPRTYHAAALVTTFANAAYLLCAVVILRKLIRNHMVFALLAATLPFFFWMFYHYNVNMTPSHGGLRYLPTMLIAVALILLPPARRFSMFSVAAIMLAWAWSFEAAIYSTFVYIVFLVVSAACDGSTTRHAIATAGRSLALLSVLLIAFVVVVLTAYVATIGKIPRYDLYLSIVLAYVGPDPFMEYAFYQNGFLAWVPVLTGYFVAVCLIARQCFARKVRKAEWTTQLAVITALGLTIGVYCIISTQTFILKVVLLPVFLLLYWAIDAGVTARAERDAVSATELGLGPVLVFVAFLLTGFSVGNFAGPPVYGTPNASILRHLLSYGRPLPKDFAPRLHRSCNPTGVTEPGSVCAPSAMPAAHHDELVQLLTRWQSDSPTLLMFHPADALMTVYLQKPHALPVSFAYVDGFSPALFRNIVERAETVIERDFRPSQVLVATKDLATLNELEWALLTRVAASWRLEQVDETAHAAAYRLTREPLRATGRILVLPDRPIRSRNTF